MADKAVRVMIEGRVQGVGFRAWMIAEAAQRGLRGWVRNRTDGRVEALIVGEPDDVEAMIAAARRGPAYARVAAVARTEDCDDDTRQFHARPTV